MALAGEYEFSDPEIANRLLVNLGKGEPVRQRARWTARMAVAALDGDRGYAAEPVFRRVGLSLATSDGKTAADWLSLPVPVLVAILVVLAGITHALIGVRSVVLDYVHTRTGALCRHGLSIDLRSLAEIGGRTDSSVAHRIAQQSSKWIINEQDRRKQVRYSMQHQTV